MRDPNRQKVLDAIERGIIEAQADYVAAAWTPLCHGPEHLITTSIFYSLADLTKESSLTLETRVTDVREYLKGKPRRGRPPVVPRGTGRVDICLWHKDEDRPRAIIEVKRCAESWRQQTKDTDIDRIGKLLLDNGARRLGFAVLASCVHRALDSTDRDELERSINTDLKSLVQFIDRKLDRRLRVKLEPSAFDILPLKRDYPEDPHSEDWLWRPVIFTIHRRPNRR